MLWKKLWVKVGRQPLTFTQHNPVMARIDGKDIPLKLAYDRCSHPYFVVDETVKDGVIDAE